MIEPIHDVVYLRLRPVGGARYRRLHLTPPHTAPHSLYTVNFLTIRAVIWQEVDHPHRALLTHVPISQPLTSREGVIAPPLLVIERQAEI